MMRKRKLGELESSSAKVKEGKQHHEARAQEGPIDLTLSDEEDRANRKKTAGSNVNLVVLSDNDDEEGEDEVLFVKEDSQIPNKSSKTGLSSLPSSSKTINDVLKDKDASKSTISKSLPPLLLSTPLAVSKHTPCSLHYEILPSKLAENLYKAMLGESNTWSRNKWYLNDKLVESNHKTCFYHSEIDGRMDDQWYMGRKLSDEDEKGRSFLKEMEQARSIIEEFVNEQLRKRKRYALEYDGLWKANVAASNCYRGGVETVGYHADQLTYLGPYPTIASLSLGTTRIFRLRGVQSLQDSSAPPPRTYDIELPHNSLCIMGAGCQERFKHTIPPARSIDVFKLKNGDKIETHIERINITFRFYRPDFLPANTPMCHCNVPCVLKADAKGKAALNSGSSGKNGNGSVVGEEMSDDNMKFFWMCFAGAQNEGKKCSFFRLLDMKSEKRGPCIGGGEYGEQR